jgi:hypothetical protein
MVKMPWQSVLGLLAQESPPSPELPEPVRQVAYMALLGILLLGMLMIVATLLGGHWVRRWGNRRRRSAVPQDVVIPRKQTSAAPKVLPAKPNGEETPGPDETRI